ncbi:MAG: hypothetical protein PHH54_04015 [Candidatus Nanoarchaeia archaeon]|nr:hypothetical protein [Candidatus Nanoarchaeia archaeon]MDD5741125.1 hypothetical protein [Candidatus Nanoarchaeia archaeon]
MENLLKKLMIGTFFTCLSIGAIGCHNLGGYSGANNPSLKYFPDAQKQDAEKTAESLNGGLPLYVVKFD